MLFENWAGLVRLLVIAPLAYAALLLLLSWSGKRTLSKMSAFDLVITVSLGSMPATVILSKEIALAEDVLSFSC